MARIRSIKPDFATSEAIAVLSIPARLHFVMLWTYADDEGRGLDNPRLIKAALWPLDDEITTETVESYQQELADAGRIHRYHAGDRDLFEIACFTEHQKPNRPVPSKFPAPDLVTSQDDSLSTQCVRSESSVSDHEPLIPVVVVESSGRGGGESRALAVRVTSKSVDELPDLLAELETEFGWEAVLVSLQRFDAERKRFTYPSHLGAAVRKQLRSERERVAAPVPWVPSIVDPPTEEERKAARAAAVAARAALSSESEGAVL